MKKSITQEFHFFNVGKTVAFMLPILERLLYRPKSSALTRVLVLVPTRELAVQVHTVARQLCQFTNVECCLAVGMY